MDKVVWAEGTQVEIYIQKHLKNFVFGTIGEQELLPS